jgi:REP element-mobilizing transposase RayT
MPNHVHVALLPKVSVPRITKSIKGFTARQANALLGRTGERFWQDEVFDRWVRNEGELQKIIAYIERNPVRAGLAAGIEEWHWSSAHRHECLCH